MKKKFSLLLLSFIFITETTLSIGTELENLGPSSKVTQHKPSKWIFFPSSKLLSNDLTNTQNVVNSHSDLIDKHTEFLTDINSKAQELENKVTEH